jgi:hypothetical protein
MITWFPHNSPTVIVIRQHAHQEAQMEYRWAGNPARHLFGCRQATKDDWARVGAHRATGPSVPNGPAFVLPWPATV